MIIIPALMLSSGLLITIAIRHLGQSAVNYYDFVALLMVAGGTISLGLALLPWEYRKDVGSAFKFLFRPEKPQHRQLVKSFVRILQGHRYQPTGKSLWLHQKIARDGYELVQLGFSAGKIESILSERIFHSVKRWKKIAAALRSLSKYPPAFGLMGTVFGLVNIMRGLAGSSDPSKLGLEMSVALVATMYGLLMANFIVNPMAEVLLKKAEEEEEYANLALETIIMFKEQGSLMESVEMLNAMIPDDQRYDLNQLEFDEGATREAA